MDDPALHARLDQIEAMIADILRRLQPPPLIDPPLPRAMTVEGARGAIEAVDRMVEEARKGMQGDG